MYLQAPTILNKLSLKNGVPVQQVTFLLLYSYTMQYLEIRPFKIERTQ